MTMKKTFMLALFMTLSLQTMTAPASANAVDVVAKSSKFSFLKTLLDWRFYAVIGPGMFLFNETVAPSAGKGLCAVERNTVGRGTVLSKDLDKRCYGDPTINSCMVANNTVALMFQIDETGKHAIRFLGKFDGGNKLMEISQFFVSIDEKKNTTPMGDHPITATIDGRGLTERVTLAPGNIIDRGDEEEAATFAHFDRLASVMKLAFSECTEGKYDAMLKKIVEQQSGKSGTATSPATSTGTKK